MQKYQKEARSIQPERKPPGQLTKHKKPFGISMETKFFGRADVHTIWYKSETAREQALARILENRLYRNNKIWLVER